MAQLFDISFDNVSDAANIYVDIMQLILPILSGFSLLGEPYRITSIEQELRHDREIVRLIKKSHSSFELTLFTVVVVMSHFFKGYYNVMQRNQTNSTKISGQFLLA